MQLMHAKIPFPATDSIFLSQKMATALLAKNRSVKKGILVSLCHMYEAINVSIKLSTLLQSIKKKTSMDLRMNGTWTTIFLTMKEQRVRNMDPHHPAELKILLRKRLLTLNSVKCVAFCLSPFVCCSPSIRVPRRCSYFERSYCNVDWREGDRHEEAPKRTTC